MPAVNLFEAGPNLFEAFAITGGDLAVGVMALFNVAGLAEPTLFPGAPAGGLRSQIVDRLVDPWTSVRPILDKTCHGSAREPGPLLDRPRAAALASRVQVFGPRSVAAHVALDIASAPTA